MLAGILQIRSPSGSNGLYILKINPGMKKAACILQAAYETLGIFSCLFGLFIRGFYSIDSNADMLIASVLRVLAAKNLNIKRFG